MVAYRGMKAIGTLTVQLDTGERLLADDYFVETLNDLRGKGVRICEFIKLAAVPDASVRGTLASMFHVGFIFAHQLNSVTMSPLRLILGMSISTLKYWGSKFVARRTLTHW